MNLASWRSWPPNPGGDDDAAWGQGLKGYGKRYAAGFADQAIGNFMTGAIYPSLLRQDPRYFRTGPRRRLAPDAGMP